MTQEQKAKAYDEALERARKVHRNYKNLFPEDSYSEDIEEIFPELRESEDERIRQKLMWLLQQDICPFPEEEVTQMLNYLEKQKELPFVKDVVLGCPGLYYYDGERMHFRDSPAMEEKQKELMPPVNVDPCDASCDAYYQRGLNKGYELGLEAGRKEQKPNIEICPHSIKSKSYKEQKPAWSEEDIDKMVNERARKSGTTKTEMQFYRQGIEDTLKSLRPSWKPSEEQMEAFKIYLYEPQYIDNSEDIKIKLVESLYNDLKKLM